MSHTKEQQEIDRLREVNAELLNHLSAVMQWIDSWEPEFTYDPEWPAYRNSANAAIAKARGASKWQCSGCARSPFGNAVQPNILDEIAALSPERKKELGLEGVNVDRHISRQCTCHPDDNPPTPCEHRYAFRDCADAAEERYLRETLAVLQEIYAKAAKPYTDRLVALHSRSLPQMLVTVEQARSLGLLPANASLTGVPASSARPG